MKSKMEIEAPTYDLGIESDFEDQSNLIVEDRDVNLHPLVGIPAEIVLFGAPKMGIFPPLGRGWRQNLPR
jgi:hypothetical protein